MADMLLDDLNRVLARLDATAPATIPTPEETVTKGGRKVC